VELTTTIEIERDAEAVFDVIADFEKNPLWQGGMDTCRWITEPPLRVGSSYEQVARFMGKTILTTFEVVALTPGRSVSISSVVSTFPIQVTREVQPLGPNRCRVHATVAGQPPWYMRAVPLMDRMVRRNVARDYQTLKAMLESP
jgi:hypothetical protein